MDVLILGGTGVLGRDLSRQFIEVGHRVTCVARGSGPVHSGATLVVADRDQENALEPVSGPRWDAVVDLTTHPGHARRAAQQVSARHWVYVSSGSVYAHFDGPATTEAAATHEPLASDTMADMSEYSAAKVACENAFRELHDPLTVIRPGLIGGDGDWTGRSGYYPWRFAHPTGNDVLVPDETQPTAILNVVDLAAWIVRCAEDGVRGTFNAAGDATELAEIYRLCQDLTNCPADVRVIDDATLVRCGIQPWMGPRSLPLWIPDPSLRHMSTLDCSQAKLQGFANSPIQETLAAALSYEERHEGPRHAGLTDQEERELRQLLDQGAVPR